MVYIKERSTNGYFLFWETSVMKLFSDRPLICVAFNCFPKCYRGWNLETIQTSKYLIGVMWCLSNMWTMLFVKNYWKRRRSRRRISYCGSVLTTLSFFHMLALRSPVSKCKFIFKTNWEDTKHSRIQCLTPFFPLLSPLDVVWNTTIRKRWECLVDVFPCTETWICMELKTCAWIPNHNYDVCIDRLLTETSKRKTKNISISTCMYCVSNNDNTILSIGVLWIHL